MMMIIIVVMMMMIIMIVGDDYDHDFDLTLSSNICFDDCNHD